MNNGVTIGIPVYNEELRIERTIRSAVGQCAKLIVVDNSSTDRTGEICEALAREFHNIEYVRHPQNLGALENWNFILGKADSEYLMFLGAHDHIDHGYIEKLLPYVSNDRATLGVFGELFYEHDNRTVEDHCFNNWNGGTKETPPARVEAMLYSRVPVVWATYGLFRTDTVKELFTKELHPYGVDVLFLAHVLAAGKLKFVHGARYNAWMRDNDELPSDYLERIFGSKQNVSKKRLRNEFRIAQHNFLLRVCAPNNFLKRLRYRLLSTIHFGTFKYPGMDLQFYLTYLPAKAVRSLIRARLRMDKHYC